MAIGNRRFLTVGCQMFFNAQLGVSPFSTRNVGVMTCAMRGGRIHEAKPWLVDTCRAHMGAGTQVRIWACHPSLA